MSPNDDLLDDVADAILDGTPIDWSEVAARAGGRDRSLLARLKLLNDLASAHRDVVITPPNLPEPAASNAATDGDGEQLGRWGHLKLVEFVGRGAYGEVYRARDIQLDRDVALKLRLADAGDTRASSIIEEGRLLARIRHPNVVTIHGAERRGDRVGLWMEFVKGRTLEQILQEGKRFTVAETVEIGIQLCHAISAVHDAGVVHRDIKSQNVMLADGGRVVLMDFGAGWEVKPNSTAALAGTPLYLAPEVLAGEEATVRSDVYAVGVLLYHLLTGVYPIEARRMEDLRRVHGRGTRVDLRTVRPGVPRGVAEIIERAIDPRPERRPERGAEMADRLRAAQTRLPRRARAALMLLATIVSLLVAVSVLQHLQRTSRTSAMRLPAGAAITPVTSTAGSKNHPALSPDGSKVAFIWTESGDWELYVKELETGRTTRMTEGGAGYPAWSADGRFLAFRRDFRDAERRGLAAVFIMAGNGGPERIVWQGAAQTLGAGLSWSADGRQIALSVRAAIGDPLRVLVVDVTTLKTRWLSRPSLSTQGDSHPVFSPDGRSIAFARTGGSDSGLYILHLATNELARLAVHGHDVRGMTWSKDGQTLVFTSYRGGGRDTLWRVPVSGGEAERVTGIGEGANAPSIGGRGRMVYRHTMLDQNVHRVELPAQRGAATLKLATSSRNDSQPDISPDGSRVAFVSDRAGSAEIWLMDADGGHPSQLTTFRTFCRSPRWSPDGRRVVSAVRPSGAEQTKIFITDVPTGVSHQVTSGPGNDLWPQWSADGESVYFGSNRSGTFQIWKIAVEGGEPVQITRDGGFKAWESSDGLFLYYSNSARAIWRMRVNGGEPTVVVRLADETDFGGEWVLLSKGIYWLNVRTSPGPSIDFFPFATGISVPALALSPAYDYGSGFSVSRDERWLVFSHREYYGSDIMMMEGLQ